MDLSLLREGMWRAVNFFSPFLIRSHGKVSQVPARLPDCQSSGGFHTTSSFQPPDFNEMKGIIIITNSPSQKESPFEGPLMAKGTKGFLLHHRISPTFFSHGHYCSGCSVVIIIYPSHFKHDPSPTGFAT